jgi:hypothetical protein
MFQKTKEANMQRAIILIGAVLFCSGIVLAQTIPTDGLVAYYTFDEEGELTVVDHSGNGLDGEIVGDAIYTDGIKGTALLFDGVGAYVNCGNNPLFDISDVITLAAWVRPYDIGDGQHDPWITKGDHAWALKKWSGEWMEFFVYDPDNPTPSNWHANRIQLDASYNDVWHHFAGTYDSFELKVYMDGELDSTVEFTGAIGVTEHEVHIAHNSDPSATGRFYNGILDEILVYDVPLTDEEIKALYDSYFDTDVKDRDATPVNDFTLQQNYPNPFNPTTTISYSLPAASFVTLNVYDVLGKEIRTLVNEKQTEGTYTVNFDATGLASGVYYYRLSAGDRVVETKKMVLMR